MTGRTFLSNTSTAGPPTLTGGGTIIVEPDAWVYGAPLGISDALALQDGPWTISVEGSIQGRHGGNGLFIDAFESTKNSRLTIGAEGSIGVLEGAGSGIDLYQATDITNSGAIFGLSGAGIQFENTIGSAHNFSIVNTKSGKITSDIVAIADQAPGAMTLKNAGYIFGSSVAIDLVNSSGACFITNTGTIEGAIQLGSANDKASSTGFIIGTIDLAAGDDSFTGGNGSETVYDFQGSDSYKLGGGADLFLAASVFVEIDKVDGGTGLDTYNASFSSFGVRINLDTRLTIVDSLPLLAKTASGPGIGTDIVTGFEVVIGSDHDDIINGGSGAEVLNGGEGIDAILGGAGNDTIDGGGNHDDITGGLGADLLTGSGGLFVDFFRYNSAAESGGTRATRDTITDFASGNDEIILNFDANTTLAGPQDFLWKGAGVFTKSAGELHYFWLGNQTLVEGDTNGDGHADFSILMNGNLSLVETDFIL